MHQRRAFAAVAAAALTIAGIQVSALSAQSAVPPGGTTDRVGAATARLQGDAPEGLRSTRDNGTLSFVGAPVGGEIRNPSVWAGMTVRAAARSHLARYGAAFGAQRPGTTMRVSQTTRSSAHEDVVRYAQRVSGLRVIGGQMVLSLRPDRQLASALATLSRATHIPRATVSQSQATRIARTAGRRAAGVEHRLPVTRHGHWVWDSRVLGAPTPLGARGVWKFSVGDGVAVKRLVLVDDRTGRVLMNLNELQEALNRVVCDAALGGTDPPAACTTATKARAEGDGPSGVADVNNAYDHSAEVDNFYLQIAGIDLTNLIGRDVGGGVKGLASTVQYCPGGCPYENAFWNGFQMYYGPNFANADDVVGHEMTHGVISHNSDLFYWGQSGAMNESFADIMGEIIDHRNTLVAGDAAWPLAEDLPGGALRNMSNPPSFGDPDRMTSPNYYPKLGQNPLGDEGGVHTNSGVGNKTAFLISQGGSFNGQTITGIDGADTTLNKTAHLYYDAIVKLTSGSDYANLADVLEQSCASFVSANLYGFTSVDCTTVAKAVLATELRTPPTNAPQPPDAAKVCPAGSTFRELFNSETGTPASKFTSSAAPSPWAYGISSDWGSNATSGHTSWFSPDPDPNLGDPARISMMMAGGVDVPAGQQTYLWFQQWRNFEWYPAGTVTADSIETDGGVVEIDDTGDGAPAQDAAGLAWVNGPSQVLDAYPGFSNEWAGKKAFAGDSFGWVASRLDLSSYAGKNIKAEFAALGDVSDSYIGWWLDDITVYTCDVPAPPPVTPQPSAAKDVTAKGRLGKAVVTWQPPVTNPGAVTGYRVGTTGKTVTVPAGTHTTVFKGLKQGKTYAFTVFALGANGFAAPPSATTAEGTRTTLKVEGAAGSTGLRGKLTAAGKGLKGKVLKVLTKKKGKWVKIDKVTTGKKGTYQLLLPGTSSRRYRVLFAGGAGLMGSESPQRHL